MSYDAAKLREWAETAARNFDRSFEQLKEIRVKSIEPKPGSNPPEIEVLWEALLQNGEVYEHPADAFFTLEELEDLTEEDFQFEADMRLFSGFYPIGYMK